MHAYIFPLSHSDTHSSTDVCKTFSLHLNSVSSVSPAIYRSLPLAALATHNYEDECPYCFYMRCVYGSAPFVCRCVCVCMCGSSCQHSLLIMLSVTLCIHSLEICCHSPQFGPLKLCQCGTVVSDC